MDEQVFHLTLRKIRWSTSPSELAAATRTTLHLMLRRPSDQQLLDRLLSQTSLITDQITLASAGHGQGAAVRQAAIRCVALLQAAKAGRLSRREHQELHRRRRQRRVAILTTATAAASALYLILLLPHAGEEPGRVVAHRIAGALQGFGPGPDRRGDITIRHTGENIIVTAERLAPEDCVAAAAEVQSVGVLKINDTTLELPSPAALASLCHQMADARLTVILSQYGK